MLVPEKTGPPWPETLLYVPPIQATVQGTGCPSAGDGPCESVHARGGSGRCAAAHLQITALHQPVPLLLRHTEGCEAGARQKKRS